ncbi:MAG: NnrU protein [Proteobacteria bacterium]|nr:NnrU protein [Pseudomonadota bacterium]
MTGTLWHLGLAALAFVGSHFLLSWLPVRDALTARIGERAFTVAYSTLSLVTLAWMGFAYARAPNPAWLPEAAPLRWVPVLAMPFACILIVGGFAGPNPTAVGQEGRLREAAERASGLLAVTRHPVMWGMGLWALAHLAARHGGADILLFGSLALLALAGTVAIDARKRARLGADFARFAAATSNLPFAAILRGRARLKPSEVGVEVIVGGLLLYGLLGGLHPLVLGTSPFGGLSP